MRRELAIEPGFRIYRLLVYPRGQEFSRRDESCKTFQTLFVEVRKFPP